MKPRWGVPPLTAALLLVGVAAHADTKSDAVIAKAIAASKAAKSLTATVEMSRINGTEKSGGTASVRLLKPNFARVVILSGAPEERVEIAMTGKDTYLVMPSEKKYQLVEGRSDPAGGPLNRIGGPVLGAFYDGAVLKEIFNAESTVTYGGKKPIGKGVYDSVTATRKGPAPMGITAYFGPSGLCEGAVIIATPPAQTVSEPGAPKPPVPPMQKVSWWLRDVKVNAPTTAAQFDYHVPAGFEIAKQPEPPDLEKSLVAVGKLAPEFNLPQPGGEKLALADLLKGKKAVLVNFWFRDCPACVAEFPHLQKLYEEKKDQGFEMVAVNASDTPDVVQKYIDENKFTFKVVMGGEGETFPLGDTYGIMAFPTSYLVGPDGTILWRKVGFDEAGLRAALEKAGVK